MKRETSALERAQRRRQTARVLIKSGRTVAAPIFGTLALVTMLIAGYQLFSQWRFESGVAANEAAANRVAVAIKNILDGQAQSVQSYAEDPGLAAVLRSSEAAISDAERKLAENAGLERALLLEPRVELITPEAYPGTNYSAIAVALLAKKDLSVAGPIVGGQGENTRLNWAAPILDGDTLVGELVATFSARPLSEALARAPGYLDIRILRKSGGSEVVDYRGSLSGGLVDSLPHVQATRNIGVGYGYDRPFGLLMDSRVGAIALLLFGLGLGVLAYWIKFQPDWSFLKRSRADDDEEELPKDDELVDSELREAMDFADEKKTTGKVAKSSQVDPSIFRTYDIRGIVGYKLDATVATLIGQAIGSEAVSRKVSQVVVARDGRNSGPEMSSALTEGLRNAGIDVIDIGAVPTGVLYFATHHLDTGSGVMVTGSHNPPEYNGFKIVLAGETLAAEAIQDLYRRIVEDDLEFGSGGVQETDVLEEYVDRIASDIQVEEPLKVVVDCGNGIPGMIAPQVLEEIGCEVIPLYCDVDGKFPNHHPDPSVPENLKDLITSVKELGADLGIALDGDGDRLGVVTREGTIIYPDRLLMLFAEDVLLRNPGATVIYDVKCTGHLAKVILRHGGSPLMWKTGHSLIKGKMKETDAALAGEMSGHFFFKERWYGFDDGIYAAARLLEILASAPSGVDQALAELPDSVSTPEIKIEMDEGEHFEFIQRFQQKVDFEGARITTIDGVRADYDDGWGLVRASNTTPCLVLRFDAENDAALKRIQGEFKRRMLAVKKDLKIPF